MNHLFPVFALFSWVAISSALAQQPTYPPYPDIWGRYLPTKEDGTALGGVLPLPDGDQLIFFGEEGKSDTVQTITFFGGHTSTMSSTEFATMRRFPSSGTLRSDPVFRQNLRLMRRISLDESHYAARPILPWQYVGPCWNNLSEAIAIFGSASQAISRKMFFYRWTEPHRYEVSTSCDGMHGRTGGSFVYEVDSIAFQILPLQDKTFLAHSLGKPFVVRLNYDLDSPFLKQPDARLIGVDIKTVSDLVGPLLDDADVGRANSIINDFVNSLIKSQR